MGGDIPEGFTADDLLSDSESEQTSAKQKTKKQTTESKNKKEKRKKKKASAIEDDIDGDEKVGEAFTNLSQEKLSRGHNIELNWIEQPRSKLAISRFEYKLNFKFAKVSCISE